MRILNLGCGSRTSSRCLNVDWSPYLRLKRSHSGSTIARVALRGERRERFDALDENILVHDLRRPLPFGAGSIDAVYHSHVLEHFDRHLAKAYLVEIHRVLRPGGVHRVVVPDFEAACRRYLSHLESCELHPDRVANHDAYIGDVIEQMVRREAAGTSEQPSLRRFAENLFLGDARRRGETHQWMYDRLNLSFLLVSTGFRDVRVLDYQTSAIPGWRMIGLDELGNGEEYKPGSLYLEATT